MLRCETRLREGAQGRPSLMVVSNREGFQPFPNGDQGKRDDKDPEHHTLRGASWRGSRPHACNPLHSTARPGPQLCHHRDKQTCHADSFRKPQWFLKYISYILSHTFTNRYHYHFRLPVRILTFKLCVSVKGLKERTRALTWLARTPPRKDQCIEETGYAPSETSPLRFLLHPSQTTRNTHLDAASPTRI